MKWSLPESLDINGTQYAINADYRIILEIISRLGDKEQNGDINAMVCLALFYQDFDAIPERDYQEAADQMLWFISYGEEPDGQKGPKLIDWEQDYQMLVSDINKVAGHDVRADKYCHWWTFLSYFMSIGEGQLSMVVSIREKLRKGKKLEKWEREYYRKNRSKVDFKRKYSQQDEEIIKKLTGR